MIVERDAKLVGERVELITGNRVGTVVDTAHGANGHVTALLVKLDSDKLVWIDSSDVRYNRADGIVDDQPGQPRPVQHGRRTPLTAGHSSRKTRADCPNPRVFRYISMA